MFDIVFEAATVVDGSGKLPYRADVGIKNDKIAAIGQLDDAKAKKRIYAKGKVLCPGFIDVHSHADVSVHLPDHPEILEPLIRQGITTFVGGNCGLALAPLDSSNRKSIMDFLEGFTGRNQDAHIRWESFGEFMAHVDASHPVMNVAMLAPHGIMRIGEMGLTKRLATRDEVSNMQDMLRDCMEAGAMGMSTGLQYFPGSQSDTEELVKLADVLHEYDGVFTSHLRSYSNTLDLAINEVKAVSRHADVQAQISHLFWVPHIHPVIDSLTRKIVRLGAKIYERVPVPVPLDLAVAEKLNLLGREIDQGLRMGVDGMPTSAGFTHLMAFFPPWVLENDMPRILKRLKDPATRKRIRRDIETGQSIWPHRDNNTWSMNFFKLMGWKCAFIMSVGSEKNKHLEGKNLVDIANSMGKHAFDVACDLLLEEDGRVLVFETVTHPGDDFVERSLFATMRDPNVSIVTDTILLGFGRPSHLFYDCYPKFISKYIRDNHSVSLPEGIRKCTALPAAQLGIKKRGEIKEQNFADLVLFDLDVIGSNSTFENPDNFPSGIEKVLINGKIIVDENGYHPKPRPGMLIRKGQQG